MARLHPDQAVRLDRCIAQLGDASDAPACAQALQALQNFYEGTSSLIPILGEQRHGLFPALVRLLETGCEVLLSLQVMEALLRACNANCKAVLRVRGTVPALVGALAQASGGARGSAAHGASDTAGLALSVCAIIRVLVRYRPALRADLITAEGAEVLAAVLRSTVRGSGSGEEHDSDMALQTVLQLAVELTAGDVIVQDILRECGCLGDLVEVLLTKLRLHMGLEPEPEPEAGARSLGAPIALSAASVADLCLCIGTLVADNDASRRTVLARPEAVEILHAGWGGATLEQLDGEGAGVAVRHALTVLLVKLLSEAGPADADAPAESGANVPRLVEGLPDGASEGLRGAFSAYHCFCEGVRQTQRFHYDDEARQEALRTMQAQLEAQPASAHLFAHVTGSIQMLVNSFNNIDQTVLAYACLLAHKLFTVSDAAQLLFCREGGLAALYECLHDYDITVRTLVLKLLTVLASNYELPTRQDMVSVESGGLLPRLIGLLQEYGEPDTDDVDLAVAEAACGLLSHLVLYEPVSPETSGSLTSAAASMLEISLSELEDLAAARGHETPMSARRRGSVSSVGSMSARGSPGGSGERQVLTNMLIVGDSHLGDSKLQCPQPPLGFLLQKLCLILSTIAYQDAGCQARLLQCGIFDLVFEMLASPGLRGYGDDLAALMSALTLLVNAVDKNAAVQDALCNPDKARTIVMLLQPTRSSSSGCSELQGLAALLIGHLCLNHHANKMLYGSRPSLDLLLGLLGSVSDHGEMVRDQKGSDGVHAAVSHDDDGLPSGFDDVQYRAGSHLNGSGSVPPEQMALGALMALINLSHQNGAVNGVLAELAVVEVVMGHLASTQTEVRKAATLFLAGLVAADKSHGEFTTNPHSTLISGDISDRLPAVAARAIADYVHPAGAVDGVELLLCNLSDDDDADDLSQHSFLVLSNMETTAADRMVSSTERYLSALPSAEPLGGHVGRMGGTPNENLLFPAEPESAELLDALGHSELCTRL